MDDFAINKYEVSNYEFRNFVRDTNYSTESEQFGWSFVFEAAIPEHIKSTITEVSYGSGSGRSCISRFDRGGGNNSVSGGVLIAAVVGDCPCSDGVHGSIY